MKYTYTIIIPHKNSPKLLQRCLDSIPHRDDLHIIVVDDNSDPDIVDFKLFPGLDRNDVDVIFTKEGKGAGYAEISVLRILTATRYYLQMLTTILIIALLKFWMNTRMMTQTLCFLTG